MIKENYLNLCGIEFIEFVNQDIQFIENIFFGFGFSKLKQFKGKDILYLKQNEINILLNNERKGFAAEFSKKHGPAISSMGWRVESADFALEEAVKRGAQAVSNGEKDLPYPAVYGIGDSLIYFIDSFILTWIYRKR